MSSQGPPKYINRKTGETWSGHARPPAWIANVKDRTKFLIANGTGAAVAASESTLTRTTGAVKKASAVAGAVAQKRQRKGPQPAKYVEPKTGATWSGRGRAPAWLASTKDRSKFLIDPAAAVAADAAVASITKQATKKATPVAKKASAKTMKATTAPAVKKAAAKNAVSAKVVAPKSAASK
ncbi:H-NS family nucleoid-associated regulatory protein [Trinickia mobilis]|uniref:H-NS family nucleoid-associated regulatory protein n=1 Tax=Trinickia mobilis TaxID=2816356 RepID=UPI001A8D08C5|nr:H-NS family nucleoid-associated regulatory protein [Trinickia mobilis]